MTVPVYSGLPEGLTPKVKPFGSPDAGNQDAHPEDAEAIVEPSPLVLTDTSEYEPGIDEYGMPVYLSKITREQSTAPVLDIGVFNYHDFMARCMMTIGLLGASKRFNP